MKKTYWTLNGNKEKREWLEMNGKQFYQFITSPAGKGRYFMDCDTYKIELSPAEYQSWKLEKNHSDYLQSIENQVVLLSLDAFSDLDGKLCAETIPDSSIDIEGDSIKHAEIQQLTNALLSLKEDERWLINNLFMRDKPLTESEIARVTGIPQQTVSYRKYKILKKLKNFLVKS